MDDNQQDYQQDGQQHDEQTPQGEMHVEQPDNNGDHHNEHSDNDAPQSSAANPQLDDVKRRALDALTPLLGNLDMDAERKFDICMNAIRFTDNKDLADVALQAALAIPEEGAKAEALVELVNEINYLQQA
jgi:hypothetical protein